MFGKKKSDPSPLGVPLGDLLLVLQPTSIKASLDGDTLVARHEHYTIRTEVVPPENREAENRPIRAVVRMTTELPRQVIELFKKEDYPEATVAWNAFAALGALSWERGKFFVGSRLTIYEADAEDAWRSLHLPLLFATIVCGTEAILGGIRRALTNEGPRGGASEWTESDFEQVKNHLSRVCVCTTGGLGLTAEFGLVKGAVTAAVGDKTALFQMMADQPHPELGGGLFCLLQMPHELPDQKRLQQVCVQLNNMEMAAQDLPPYFGAWCKGKVGNNPAYVSFFPGAGYSSLGIAVNAAVWAIARAQWANLIFASLGIRAR
jgi:hypothetical protein